MLADPILYNQPQSPSIATAAQVHIIATASCDPIAVMQLVGLKQHLNMRVGEQQVG